MQTYDNSGYGAYCMFHALRRHFTSNYDFFKYNGKLKLSPDTFSKDKSKYQYYKLSRKYTEIELKEFLVSNFIEGKTGWVGDLLSAEADSCHLSRLKRIQSLTYTFTQDLDRIFDNGVQGTISVVGGEHPKLLKLLMGRIICPETFIIMNSYMNFMDMWDLKMKDDIIWEKQGIILKKYTPFLTFDTISMKNVIIGKIKEYS